MKESTPIKGVVNLSYFDELSKAMTWLGEQSETIFLGQSVAYPGNAIYKTLSGVPMSKKIEMPVAEDMQMGISIGLALTGKVPISIFPRMDFLMCCMNQLVNHLDKNLYEGKVIIRTCVGSRVPMNPGVQHCRDYTEALETILQNVVVRRLRKPADIVPAYQRAYGASHSTLLVEYGDLHAGS